VSRTAGRYELFRRQDGQDGADVGMREQQALRIQFLGQVKK
jgi:hypothetical protein